MIDQPLLNDLALILIGGTLLVLLARRFAAPSIVAYILAPEGEPKTEEVTPSRPRDHIIVVGMNALGRRVVRELCRRGETVLAVDVDREKLLGLPCQGLLGNVEYPSALEEASFERAKLVVSALRVQELAAELRRRGLIAP